MENPVLQAKLRGTGRHTLREMRGAGRIPAVMYGPGIEPRPIMVDSKELHKTLAVVGAGLLALQIGDETPIRVLAREVQHHVIKHRAIHVDFLAVSMTEKLRLHVPIVMDGTAPALSHPDIVMVRNMDSVEIECLPTDIPNHLVASISNLKNIDDSVYVRDLVLPPGVRVTADPEQLVISLTHARVVAEEEAPAEGVSADQVEVVSKGKKEEELA